MRRHRYNADINNFNKYFLSKIQKLRNMLPSDIPAWSAHAKAASPLDLLKRRCWSSCLIRALQASLNASGNQVRRKTASIASIPDGLLIEFAGIFLNHSSGAEPGCSAFYGFFHDFGPPGRQA